MSEPASIRPPMTNGCWDCGRAWSAPGWVDAWIPNNLWVQIAPLPNGRGHLCIHCITFALSNIGATSVHVELWAGPFTRGGGVDTKPLCSCSADHGDDDGTPCPTCGGSFHHVILCPAWSLPGGVVRTSKPTPIGLRATSEGASA